MNALLATDNTEVYIAVQKLKLLNELDSLAKPWLYIPKLYLYHRVARVLCWRAGEVFHIAVPVVGAGKHVPMDAFGTDICNVTKACQRFPPKAKRAYLLQGIIVL